MDPLAAALEEAKAEVEIRKARADSLGKIAEDADFKLLMAHVLLECRDKMAALRMEVADQPDTDTVSEEKIQADLEAAKEAGEEFLRAGREYEEKEALAKEATAQATRARAEEMAARARLHAAEAAVAAAAAAEAAAAAAEAAAAAAEAAAPTADAAAPTADAAEAAASQHRNA